MVEDSPYLIVATSGMSMYACIHVACALQTQFNNWPFPVLPYHILQLLASSPRYSTCISFLFLYYMQLFVKATRHVPHFTVTCTHKP